MKTLAVLRKYFGLQEGQSLSDFAAELKALSDEDKRELAELAAVELNVELEA